MVPEAPGDGDTSLLEGLSHGLQNASLELRKLIQEKDAMMCERDLAGCGIRVTPQEPGVACRVMRRPERALGDQRLS